MNEADRNAETVRRGYAALEHVHTREDGRVVGVHRNTATRNGKHLDPGLWTAGSTSTTSTPSARWPTSWPASRYRPSSASSARGWRAALGAFPARA